jgi:tetratricopeptide (TPR) repeat protein
LAAPLTIAGIWAAYAGAIDDCNQVRNPDRQLRGCSAYIKSGAAEAQNLATAFLNRANVYAQRGQYAKAFADYERALQLDPGNPLVPYNLGNAYLDSGRPDRAAKAFTQAISLDQAFALAYLNRGIARERLGDKAGAIEDFRQVLELDPTAERARRHLGTLRAK